MKVSRQHRIEIPEHRPPTSIGSRVARAVTDAYETVGRVGLQAVVRTGTALVGALQGSAIGSAVGLVTGSVGYLIGWFGWGPGVAQEIAQATFLGSAAGVGLLRAAEFAIRPEHMFDGMER